LVTSYSSLGLAVVLAGIVIALISYFLIHSAPFISLGLASIIIGSSCFLLPTNVSGSSAMGALLESSILSTEDALSELSKEAFALPILERSTGFEKSESDRGVSAIYLPQGRDHRAQVFLPLDSKVTRSQIELMQSAPGPIEFFKGDRNRGIKIMPAGSRIGMLLQERIENHGLDLEDQLRKILIDSTELCSSLTMSETETEIVLDLENIQVSVDAPIYFKTLGSIPCSVAASVVASIRNQPLVILDEVRIGSRNICRFLLV
jgi:hypothetical protein